MHGIDREYDKLIKIVRKWYDVHSIKNGVAKITINMTYGKITGEHVKSLEEIEGEKIFIENSLSH